MKITSEDYSDTLQDICVIVNYFLGNKLCKWSSGDDGYDSILDNFVFFYGDILSYKVYYLKAIDVIECDCLFNAVTLTDMINGVKHET